jgi:demethoxyubiquinone hydroxylase (CLK1/Coq7/Cat5 family)
MSDAVLAAVVSGCVAVLSGVISGLLSQKLTAWRVEQLERKVEKHNNLIERMVAVEQSAKSAHHRIDGLEDRG